MVVILLLLLLITIRGIAQSNVHPICLMTKVRLLTPLYSCHLLEWIHYHIELGVDKVYIINDCTPDSSNLYESLSSLIAMNKVEVVKSRTCAHALLSTKLLFQHFIKQNCAWVANIDLDEFMVFRDDYHGERNLSDFISKLNSKAYRMKWWIMNHDGQETHPFGLVIENYRWGGYDRHQHVKTLAKVSHVERWSHPHFPRFYNSTSNASDPQELIFEKPFSQPSEVHQQKFIGKVMKVIHDDIYLHHYRFNSWEEYSSQRGVLNLTATGVVNHWRDNPRAIWTSGLSMNPQAGHPQNHNYFVFTMVPKVKKRLYDYVLQTFHDKWEWSQLLTAVHTLPETNSTSSEIYQKVNQVIRGRYGADLVKNNHTRLAQMLFCSIAWLLK